jgi:D-inositol-3-phosphate glycosyltransferase
VESVVLLSPAHPLRGGIASSSERLAQELQQHGMKVRICSFSLQYPAVLFPGKSQYAEGPAPAGLDIRAEMNSVNPFNWYQVGQRLRREAPDLIIVRYWLPFMAPCLGSILRLARRNGHTKAIALTDNAIPHEKRPGDRLLTRYFIGSTDGFVVMSRSVEQDIRQFTAAKPIRYIPHPVYDNYGPLAGAEESRQRLGLPPEGPYLLFFGFIRHYKGLSLLLEAMAEPAVRQLGLKLIVAGEFYENPAPYRELIQRLGLESQVFLHDTYIPDEQVRYYFGAADLVVQPYRSATQSGISQLAYHFEKPMVVTRVGGLPEIVAHEQEGYVVEVEPGAIAAAIADFFIHQRAAAMGARVREGKKRFSWANMAAGMKKLYSEL